MTEREFEQRLRADLRQLVDKGASPALRASVIAIPDVVSPVPQRRVRARWRFPSMNRFAPFGLAAMAVVVILIGIGLFVRWPNIGPPSVPTATPELTLPPSRASNGWIAYSTDGQNPGSTDITTGSDIYLVREGGEPRLIAGRQGGTTRNVCPAFSPDGTRLAFGVASNQGRAVVVLGLNANGAIGDTVHITLPGSGPGVCVRWSSDGTRVGYLDGGIVVVRGLDGSTPPSAVGDPGVQDLERGRDPTVPLLSPAGDRIARIAGQPGPGCQIVVSRPDGRAAHAIAMALCGYAIAAWSPDGRQVLLLQEVGSADFALQAIAVDSLFQVTIVSTVTTNGARSEPGMGDVSWQPVFP